MAQRIEPITDPYCLIKADTDQINPQQRIFLYLNYETGELSLDTLMRAINGVAFDIYFNLAGRIELAPNVDPVALTAWLNGAEAGTLIGRIAAGFTEVWDGHNSVGRLTGDAAQALDELTETVTAEGAFLLANEIAGVWEATDWFNENDPDVTIDMSDAKLDALARQYDAEAYADGVVLCDTFDYLFEFRESLKQAEDDSLI